MYKNILICLDNSDHSTAGIDIGLFIARHSGATVTGCHVYAANLPRGFCDSVPVHPPGAGLIKP